MPRNVSCGPVGPIVYKTAEAALWTIFAGLPNTPRPITGTRLLASILDVRKFDISPN